jgi:CheY-like chemotaxis protein
MPVTVFLVGNALDFDLDEEDAVDVESHPLGAAYPLPEPLASVLLDWAIDGSEAPSAETENFETIARRVLVVEDDRVSRRALSRLFAARGWEVAEAATLAEGFEALDPPPSCIVLDLMLPDGDGAELLRHVRATGLPTRVVVATGIEDQRRLQAIARLRPDSLIRKPIDFDVLCRDCSG